MPRLIAALIILVAGLLFAAAAATLVNLVFIIQRPETISVVNTMIGQGILIICLLALGQVLLKRGLRRLRPTQKAESQAIERQDLEEPPKP